ncbi:MAG TPA: squalene/phytoene synthase family protein [Hyphomicrobiaceae bacterium]|nr:squalene/phytoene synthase family protein [Hyphomicrobiaceae bacterium]
MPPPTFIDVGPDAGRLEPIHAAISASARAGEPDRYLAALLAAAPARGDLLALAAFAAELARVANAVMREPAMAELRWQWWREALALPAAARSGHPIADRLRALMERYGLARADLMGLIDAHAGDLEPVPFASEAALEDYLRMTEGVLFSASARILGLAADGSAPAWSAWAGQAYGLARLLFGLKAALARGRCPIPRPRLARVGLDPEALIAAGAASARARLVGDLAREALDSLARARRDATKLPRETSIAVLPLALVESYVRASVRAEAGPPQRLPQVAPLTRVLRIAGAHWFGRW